MQLLLNFEFLETRVVNEVFLKCTRCGKSGHDSFVCSEIVESDKSDYLNETISSINLQQELAVENSSGNCGRKLVRFLLKLIKNIFF